MFQKHVTDNTSFLRLWDNLMMPVVICVAHAMLYIRILLIGIIIWQHHKTTQCITGLEQCPCAMETSFI